MDFSFENKTMDQISEGSKKNTLILLPVGILEEHGPHLPVNTDNVIANDISYLIAERLNPRIQTWVLPTIWAGYHGKHLAQLPGSIKVKQETLFNYIYDICESLCLGGFKKIAIINGHGQNPAVLEIVCRKIADDYGVNILITYPLSMIGKKEGLGIKKSPEGGAGGHACEVETSLVMALRDNLVDISKAPEGDICNYKNKFIAGDLFPEHEVIKFGYWSTFAIQGTKSGVLGEPKYATKENGEKFIQIIVDNYIELLQEYYFHEERTVGN